MDKYQETTYNIKASNKGIKGNLYDRFKRIMDILLALIGLVIGLPLIIIFGIAIAIESPGEIGRASCRERVFRAV